MESRIEAVLTSVESRLEANLKIMQSRVEATLKEVECQVDASLVVIEGRIQPTLKGMGDQIEAAVKATGTTCKASPNFTIYRSEYQVNKRTCIQLCQTIINPLKLQKLAPQDSKTHEPKKVQWADAESGPFTSTPRNVCPNLALMHTCCLFSHPTFRSIFLFQKFM